jgi:D-amino peptidase
MNVYISADFEGCTGLVSWGQAGTPSSDHYDWQFARRMMTRDVNSAIRGARAAGADRVVVKDSHNTGKNLLIDDLEDGTELISGSGSGELGMMEGVDQGFDCAMLVGYHGMAGTARGIMEHTISGGVHHYWINGMPAGEIAMSAATAGACGVPLVLISSDNFGCSEAKALIPGIETAVVKQGLGRYMGHLQHPSVTGPVIEAAAEKAVAACGSASPWKPSVPVTVRIEQNRSEEIDVACLLPGWERLDAFTIEAVCDTWELAHVMSRRAMAAAGSGASNNR